jgi:hypothetical protein
VKEPINVGDQFGQLTVLQVSPLHLMCVCGTEVTKYKVSHLHASRHVKSCGCMRRSATEDWEGQIHGDIKILSCMDPGEKVRFRFYRVECMKCGTLSTMGRETVGTAHTRKYGCTGCIEKRHKGRERTTNARIYLEPVIDAQLRTHCNSKGLTYTGFIKAAIATMLVEPMSYDDIPDHRATYGRFGSHSFSVPLTVKDKKKLKAKADELGLRMSRTNSKLIRFAVSQACARASSSDAAPKAQ